MAHRLLRLSALVALPVAMLLSGCGGSHKSGSAAADGGKASAELSGSDSPTVPGSGAGADSAPGSTSAPIGSKSAGSSTSAGAKPAPSSTAAAGQEGASAPSVNACTTAGSDDVTKAFGGKVVSATTSTTGTGAQLCRFVVADARAAKNLTISLSTHKPVTVADFNAGRSAAIKAGATSVSGVGSAAYYSRSNGTLQFLFSSTGGFVEVQAPLAPGTTLTRVEPASIALAKAVIANS